MNPDLTQPDEVPVDIELAAFLRQLSRRVRWLRFERELTQEELAAAAGMSRSFISLIEQGEHGMNLVRLYHLARAFDGRCCVERARAASGQVATLGQIARASSLKAAGRRSRGETSVASS